MVTATITAKGQITIPKCIRDSLRLGYGDRVAFSLQGDSEAVMCPLTRSVDEVYGKLHRTSQPVRSIKQMDEAVACRMRKRKS